MLKAVRLWLRVWAGEWVARVSLCRVVAGGCVWVYVMCGWVYGSCVGGASGGWHEQ